MKISTVRKLPPPVERDADDAAMLDQVVGFYHETLKQSPEALAYLEKRGLTHPEMIEPLPAGLCESHAGAAVAGEEPQGGRGDARRVWQKLGIIRESGHEHFNGSLVIPVFDAARRGGWDVRAQDHGESAAGHAAASVSAGPASRACGTRQALEASKEIILCESLIDALTFWCAGFRNVTASYGVNGLHGRSPGGLPEARRHAGDDRLRPRRSGREGRGGAGR